MIIFTGGLIVRTLLEVLVVLIATLIVSVHKLMKKNTVQEETEGAARNNKKVSWTVVILSTLFIVFNVTFIIAATARMLPTDRELQESRRETVHELFWHIHSDTSQFCHQSCSVFVVYLVRINDMRQFFVH